MNNETAVKIVGEEKGGESLARKNTNFAASPNLCAFNQGCKQNEVGSCH